MEIPQVSNTGIEQAAGVKPQEQQGGQQAGNTGETPASPVDVVTISQEAQEINNTRATETATPTPAANNTETTREKDVEQIVQNNLNEDANTENQTPENANPVDEIA